LERPERKIMLVHGHPGLGKTTLAHVIAQTAGYSVIEINARYIYPLLIQIY
jgi:chromosome transmission fidelity protein 18